MSFFNVVNWNVSLNLLVAVQTIFCMNIGISVVSMQF